MTALLASVLLVLLTSPPALARDRPAAPRRHVAPGGFSAFLLLPLLIPMPVPLALALPPESRAALAKECAREAEAARRDTAARVARRPSAPDRHRRNPR